MFIPPYRASRDLKAFSDSIIHCFICYDDISPFAECWNYAAYGGESLCIDYTCWDPKVSCDIRFCLDMYILSSVKSRWRTGSNSISPKNTNRLFLEIFIANEVVEIV